MTIDLDDAKIQLLISHLIDLAEKERKQKLQEFARSLDNYSHDDLVEVYNAVVTRLAAGQ